MMKVMMLSAALLMGGGVVQAAEPVLADLVGDKTGPSCLADKSLCLELEATDDATVLALTGSGRAAGPVKMELPNVFDDPQTFHLWPKLIFVPRADGDSAGARDYLVGVIARTQTAYSGGGGSGGRLYLFRVSNANEARPWISAEVLNVEWDSYLMIRACFSETDGDDRLGACHDEYNFTATLAAAANDGGELPALTYRTVATAFPQTARRSEDSSGTKLKKSDLTTWRDPECSYVRKISYNPATLRYEMERPAPDCSEYTVP